MKPDYSNQVKRVQESIGILKLRNEIIEEEKKERKEEQLQFRRSREYMTFIVRVI